MRRREDEKQFEEKVVEIRRVSKKTEGGNRFTFTALVVVGDRNGRVGVAMGRAPSVRPAIEKATKKAQTNMVTAAVSEGTIPFPIEVKVGGAHILLRPAPSGAGIVVGGAVRVVAELAGIRDISGKVLGSRNKYSNVLAMFEAFRQLNQLTEKYGSK